MDARLCGPGGVLVAEVPGTVTISNARCTNPSATAYTLDADFTVDDDGHGHALGCHRAAGQATVSVHSTSDDSQGHLPTPLRVEVSATLVDAQRSDDKATTTTTARDGHVRLGKSLTYRQPDDVLTLGEWRHFA